MLKITLLLALAICAPAFADSGYEIGSKEEWANAHFDVLKFETIPAGASDKPTAYTFPLSAVLVKDSQWSREAILEHIQRARKIYEQCDMSPSPITLITVEPPLGYSDALGTHRAEIASLLPSHIRPVLFFMNVNGPSEAFAEDFTADSPMRSLTYTAWIAEDVNTAAYRKMRDATYDPVAHELAHMIGNRGHVQGRNLLSGNPAEVNGELTKGQCADFQKSPLVKKRK